MCCSSTQNGWCCNTGSQCCPWHKPLVDKNGNCYTCDEEKGVDVTGAEYNCNACSGRELLKPNNKQSLCAISCPKDTPLRGNDGKCYSCDYETPVVLIDKESCSSICSNRENFNGKCIIPCPTNEFASSNGV